MSNKKRRYYILKILNYNSIDLENIDEGTIKNAVEKNSLGRIFSEQKINSKLGLQICLNIKLEKK